MTSSLSQLNVGFGLRRAHFAAFLGTQRHIDFVEIIAEAFVGVGGLAARALAAAKERGPVLVHGVSLGIGNETSPSTVKLKALAHWLDSEGLETYSDHLCASGSDGIESFDLLPLPFHDAAIEHTAGRLRDVRRALGRPIVLENISRYAEMPDSQMAEGPFLDAVLRAGDASLLLDVANVLVTAKNLGLDPYRTIDSFPLHRVTQLHVAGHRYDPRMELVIDDHASAISDETLRLTAYARRRIGGNVPILIEWDQRLPDFHALLDETDRVRRALFDLAHETGHEPVPQESVSARACA